MPKVMNVWKTYYSNPCTSISFASKSNTPNMDDHMLDEPPLD